MGETFIPQFDFEPARDGHATVHGDSVQQAIITIKRWAAEQEGDFLVLAPWASGPPRPHWTQVAHSLAWAQHLSAARDAMSARYERLADRERRSETVRPLFVIIDERALLGHYVNDRTPPAGPAAGAAPQRDALEVISDIARLGRAAGVHLVVVSAPSPAVRLTVLRDCARQFDLNRSGMGA